MAYTPCDKDHRMYSGRGTAYYPALLNGTHELRRKRKVCPAHWEGIKTSLATVAAPIVDGQEFPNQDTPACTRCGELSSHENLAGLFVTVYEQGSAREDWFGKICGSCFDDVAYSLLLADQEGF